MGACASRTRASRSRSGGGLSALPVRVEDAVQLLLVRHNASRHKLLARPGATEPVVVVGDNVVVYLRHGLRGLNGDGREVHLHADGLRAGDDRGELFGRYHALDRLADCRQGHVEALTVAVGHEVPLLLRLLQALHRLHDLQHLADVARPYLALRNVARSLYEHRLKHGLRRDSRGLAVLVHDALHDDARLQGGLFEMVVRHVVLKRARSEVGAVRLVDDGRKLRPRQRRAGDARHLDCRAVWVRAHLALRGPSLAYVLLCGHVGNSTTNHP